MRTLVLILAATPALAQQIVTVRPEEIDDVLVNGAGDFACLGADS